MKRRILRNPETDASRVLLAASYGQMGLIDEAREAWREALIASIRPIRSNIAARCCLTRTRPISSAIVEGLRKAGLPER